MKFEVGDIVTFKDKTQFIGKYSGMQKFTTGKEYKILKILDGQTQNDQKLTVIGDYNDQDWHWGECFELVRKVKKEKFHR